MTKDMTMHLDWAALKAHESNAKTYARNIDIILTRGEGSRLFDQDNRAYLDCLASAGALPLGHNHPYVMERVQRFLRDGHPLQALDIATPAKIEFMTQLLRALPEPFARHAKVQFCGPSGSDAVESALKLFKTATGRRSVLAFHGAYHGQTMGALSLMGNIKPKQAVSGQMSEVHFLPYPNAYRCPFGVGGTESERLSLAYIANILEDPESGITKPAAIILEAVQGEGGCVPASAAWLQGIRALTLQHDIPLVIDEVMTGLCRTGTRFAHEIGGIVPDAIVLSKAVGGGFPLALLAYQERFDTWQPGAHAGTFRGNQIAFAAGAATMEYMLENGIEARVQAVGAVLRNGLEALQHAHPVIGDVRGRGLMLGVEIIDPDAKPTAYSTAPAADGQLAHAIKIECLKQGLIIENGGRHSSVLRFLPPLILTEDEAGEIVACFARALESVEAHRPR